MGRVYNLAYPFWFEREDEYHRVEKKEKKRKETFEQLPIEISTAPPPKEAPRLTRNKTEKIAVRKILFESRELSEIKMRERCERGFCNII